ncbi:FecCD family ABC transporter permease [Gordonia shandongensis]|uniref:FecCD family ABC transporter permease n=1 Tax=Gordonia shandongensis TaxID=376351 RepID=UPI000400B7F4|nr:iron ABC transporter permease [Gordonia shandongensis]
MSAPPQTRESAASPTLQRAAWALPTAYAALVVVAVVSLGLGSVYYSVGDILTSSPADAADNALRTVVWDVRLPRVLLAILVGAAIAVSGALLQTVMGNPLADPGLTGVTSGAASLVLVILLAFPSLHSLIPLAAFVGGTVAAGVVYTLAWRKDGIKPISIILAGVAVNALAGAFIAFLSLRYSDRLPAAIQWMNGSMATKGMDSVWMVLPYTVIGLVLALLCIPSANVMRLGDDVARNLGEGVNRTRILLSVVAVFLAAAAVAAVGIIGFVGLVVPHIARMIVGSNHAVVIPMSTAMGALLVLLSDTLGRTAFSTEIPAGIIMAAIGAPYFLFLMRRQGI